LDVKSVLHKVFAKNAYSNRYIEKLYRDFALGLRHDTHRCPVPGRPRTALNDENRDMLSTLMRESRTWTTQELADQIGISYGSTHNLLVEMDYRKVGSHWLPHELSCEGKRIRVEKCKENLDRYTEDESILDRIIAIDETYIRSYMPHDRHLAREWRLPHEE
jgi:hypothetical protein